MHARRLYSAAALLAAVTLVGAVVGCASAPPYQGYTADQLFEVGAQKYAEEDWGETVKVFERLLSSEPTFDRIVEARMYLARAYFNRGDFITAISEFTRVQDRHPGHSLAPEASLGVCKAYVELSPIVQRDQEYTVQALNACENTLADFPTSPVAAEARALRDRMEEKLAEKLFIAGDFYFKRKIYPSAIVYFDDVLEQHPGTDAAANSLLRLYQSYTEMNWEREAQEARDRLLREYPDSEAARSIRVEGDGGASPDGGSASRRGGGGGGALAGDRLGRGH